MPEFSAYLLQYCYIPHWPADIVLMQSHSFIWR